MKNLKLLFLTILFFICKNVLGQAVTTSPQHIEINSSNAFPVVVETNKQDTTKDKMPVTYLSVEQMPEFPGGDKALYQFLSKNIRYPGKARENEIEGKVILQFVVDEDGNISDIKTLRDLGGGCTEESIRVLKMMPKWKPGIQNGKAVRVELVLPIAFKLNEEEEKITIVQPSFPGGEDALIKFLSKNIKYPKQARKNGTEGEVELQFVVKADGTITDINAIKPVSGGFTEEAIRVVKKMPKWIPGTENGFVKDEKVTLPVEFKLK